MNIKKYEVLAKVIDLGSLTRAAETLGITQSGVSHIIAGVEEEFGFPIMKRSRAGAFLTTDGQRIMPFIRGILNYSKQLDQTVAAVRGLDTGTIRVATFTSVAVHWLPGMMKEFQNDYPRIEFELFNGDYHDVNKWLAEGSVDIGFITLPTDLTCDYVPLVEDRLLAILPLDHKLAEQPGISLTEVESEPFISLLESSDHDARRALKTAGVKPNIKFTTKDDYAIIAMVEQGMGISVMPELLLEGRQYNVKALPLMPPVSRTIAMAITTLSQPGPATRCFADYIIKWVEKHYQKSETSGTSLSKSNLIK